MAIDQSQTWLTTSTYRVTYLHSLHTYIWCSSLYIHRGSKTSPNDANSWLNVWQLSMIANKSLQKQQFFAPPPSWQGCPPNLDFDDHNFWLTPFSKNVACLSETVTVAFDPIVSLIFLFHPETVWPLATSGPVGPSVCPPPPRKTAMYFTE